MEKQRNHDTVISKGGGPLDRSRINMNEGYEVRYWAKEFNVSAEQIRSAVRRVGPTVENVRHDLKRGGL